LKQSLHKINVKAISGEEQALSRFEGKVLLIVNVASQCGFTPQYLALQNIYEKYRDQGSCILAFPSNDFGRQEPAEDKEIEKFCVKNFGISFNLFSKVRVLGPKQSPLYPYLQESNLVAVEKTGIKTMIMHFLARMLLKIRGDVTPKPNEIR
jgi:glutathione peroxidase